MKNLLSGIAAGVLISIGGSVYLACENKVVGAVFFSVALLCICYKGYSLYTGRIGYLAKDHKKSDLASVFIGLVGNAIATVACGILVSLALPSLSETAGVLRDAKLAQPLYSAFIRGIFCGVLMYLAVSIFKENNKNPIAIIFCIPVFILSGFEHSVADIFYFAASASFKLQMPLYTLIIVLGNSAGSLLLCAADNRLRGRE